MFTLSQSSASFGLNSQGNSWVYNSSLSNIAGWQHFVCVFQGGIMKVYKNGVLSPITINYALGSNSSILPFYFGGDYVSPNFSGIIDDVGKWNRALTDTEVNMLYNGVSLNVEINEDAKLDFNIYPNPAREILNIDFNHNNLDIKAISVFDVSGRKVINCINCLTNIDVSSLFSGLYVIRVELSSGQTIEKCFNII